MSKAEDDLDAGEKLTLAYEKMMARVRDAAEHLQLSERIDAARDAAVELGELSREEADRIGRYLQRDLHDAAEFLSETGSGLAEWLRFDVELLEDRLAEMLATMVDDTRIELDRLALQARVAEAILQSGDVIGPGAIECDNCGNSIEFHKVSYIPDCPKCGGKAFHRYRADT